MVAPAPAIHLQVASQPADGSQALEPLDQEQILHQRQLWDAAGTLQQCAG